MILLRQIIFQNNGDNKFMVILRPQNGTSLIETIKEAIQICNALNKAKMHSAIFVEFNDITFCINEKCDIEYTIKDIYEKIKWKYNVQGGKKSSLSSNEFWMDFDSKLYKKLK